MQREGGREGGLPSVTGLLRVPPPGDLAGRRPSGRSAAPPRDDEDARRRPPPPPRPSSSRVAVLRRSLRPLQPAPRSVPPPFARCGGGADRVVLRRRTGPFSHQGNAVRSRDYGKVGSSPEGGWRLTRVDDVSRMLPASGEGGGVHPCVRGMPFPIA